MNSQITGLKVSGVIFGLMAFGQFMRLIMQPPIYVGTHIMPLYYKSHVV